MLLRKTLKNIAISTILLSSVALAQDNIVIPQMGTAGVRGMTIQAERNYGEYFKRKAQGAGFFATDPVMVEYINTVGRKLIMNSQDVYFPFEFFFSSNRQLNAAAFIGGKVQVNAGLFHYTKNEDEFASVLAHEIAHITQRHIARFIEQQANQTTYSIASIIGSIVLAVINPQIGMAAISSTTGLLAQAGINFTRDNEYEADRVGITTLYNAGYNPMAMSDLFRTLLSQQGNINPAFAMLIDHPLSEIRVAEAYNRAQALPKRKYTNNPNFMLAKARVDVRFMGLKLKDFKARLLNASVDVNEIYKNYALALIFFEEKDYSKAREYLSKLNYLHHNDFVLDLLTDIDIATNNKAQAVSRLAALYKDRPNDQVISLNLANAYLENNQAKQCIKVVTKVLQKDPSNILALDLKSQAYFKLQDKCNAYQASAEQEISKGLYNQANQHLTQALHYCTGNTREIVRAKFKVFADIRAFDEQFEKK